MLKTIIFATLVALGLPSAAQPPDSFSTDVQSDVQGGSDQRSAVQQVRVPARQKFDPLRLNVVMQFPANVKTVQQAAQYLLETANFKLVLNPADPDGSRQIFARSLLPQDIDGSLQTIENALLLIGGDDTVLIIDRANKLITFEFLPQ